MAATHDILNIHGMSACVPLMHSSMVLMGCEGNLFQCSKQEPLPVVASEGVLIYASVEHAAVNCLDVVAANSLLDCWQGCPCSAEPYTACS
jgi:hypothetical protein